MFGKKKRIFEAASPEASHFRELTIYGIFDRFSDFYTQITNSADNPERFTTNIERAAYYGAVPHINDLELHILGYINDSTGEVRKTDKVIIYKKFHINKERVHDVPDRKPESKAD